MAGAAAANVTVINLSFNPIKLKFKSDPRLLPMTPQLQLQQLSSSRRTRIYPISFSSSVIGVYNNYSSGKFRSAKAAAFPMFTENPVVGDVVATALSGGIAVSLLRLWGEIAKMGILDQKLNRKLVHISIGLVFMLCWPMFSSGNRGAVLAALVPGVNIIKVLLLGLGVWKDEATVKSMSRFGDHRF